MSLFACTGNDYSDEVQLDIAANSENNINIWPVLDIIVSGRTELIGAKEHREVAQQAVIESLVLLKNKKISYPLVRTLIS
jgi:beta-glucosidase-like glycosyl hydrolase